MDEALAKSVARSMDIEDQPEVLSLLPELLADVDALGSEPGVIVDALRPLGIGADHVIADLGCGKGSVSIALAESLGCRVVGIDAMEAFIEAAGRSAEAQGVADLCDFRVGPIDELLGGSERFDVAICASIGDALGDAARTVGHARTIVRSGGLIVIDDVFLPDDTPPPATAYSTYADHATTIARLTSHRDVLVSERIQPHAEADAQNAAIMAAVRKRATTIISGRPELREPIERYLRAQEDEIDILTTVTIGATWVLRRA